MDCPDCDRLNEAEAEAAIALVEADQAISPFATIAESEAQKRRREAAEACWNSTREHLTAHNVTHR